MAVVGVCVGAGSLNVREESVKQFGDILVICSGHIFRDRESFEVCMRGCPGGGLFVGLV